MKRPRIPEAIGYGLLPWTYLGLFFGLPVLVVLLQAFDAPGPAWTALAHLVASPREAFLRGVLAFGRLWDSPYHRNRIVFTFAQAAASTVVTLAAGIPLAYIFSHHRFAGRRLLRALFTAPFVLPPIVVALALLGAWGPTGTILPGFLPLLGPVGAIILAHAYYNIGLVSRIVGNLWERQPMGLTEAARTLGASRWRTWWHVELPFVRPAIAASSLLVFVFTLTGFGIILFLGVSTTGGRVGTIETALYEALKSFRPRYATAGALALLQLGTTYAALTAFVLLQRRLRTPTVPRTEDQRESLPWWGGLSLVVATFLILAPLVGLVVASLRYLGSWSVEPWRMVLTNSQPLGSYAFTDALRNSTTYALGTLVVALPLATLAALAAHRARRAAWGEALLMLPLGLSSIIIGLGLVLTWDGDPLPDLRASRARVLLAHVLVAFPFAARVIAPALESIEPALREAARTLGATRSQVVRRIDLPLIRPTLAVAATFAAAASLGEFGAALLLRRPETTTLPLAVYDGFSRIGAPFRAQANVYAVVLLLVAVIAFLIIERVRGRAGGDFT